MEVALAVKSAFNLLARVRLAYLRITGFYCEACDSYDVSSEIVGIVPSQSDGMREQAVNLTPVMLGVTPSIHEHKVTCNICGGAHSAFSL